MNSSKVKLDNEITQPYFLVDTSHQLKVVAKHTFFVLNGVKVDRYGCIKSNALQLKNNWGCMINNNRNKGL